MGCFQVMQQQFTPSELDYLLTIIENPVRRSIIKRLSQEPTYPLQLSKELGIGQQLIAKHLDALEGAGLVISSMTPSPSGPERKEYTLRRSVSVTLDFAPNLYSARLIGFDHLSLDKEKNLKTGSALLTKIEKIIRSSDERGRIAAIGKIITEIDEKIRDLEDERSVLLYVRNLAMNEAVKLVRESEKSMDSRRVLYHILDSHNKNVSNISESVNLREERVRSILRELERDLLV
jgi:ArsR family transcriptional regulator